ncbi:hypothetical protein Hanom_Chr07g00627381 [Helianthus anomalus]
MVLLYVDNTRPPLITLTVCQKPQEFVKIVARLITGRAGETTCLFFLHTIFMDFSFGFLNTPSGTF